MKRKKHKLIWANIHEKDNMITPRYFFEFDKLNEIGFPDAEMLIFIEEMKTIAQKEIKERRINQQSNKNELMSGTEDKLDETALCEECRKEKEKL